jgi:hypothetical protein
MSTKKVFTARTTPITYADTPAYKPTTDFFSALEQASSTVYKTANQYQINVLPDFGPILMTIIWHANRATSLLESVDHPKVSVFTYVAYCLNLVYAFFLVHDYELNFSQSHYAQDIMIHRAFESYYEHLQSMPVPAFLVTIFARLQQTLLDKQNTILVTPSFNGFTHYTHFGRFFPIDIFFGLHDIVASYDARAAILQNIQDYELRTIFNITALNVTPFGPAPTNVHATYYHSHFFASYFPLDPTAASAPQTANNRLSQFLSAIFNMKDLRSYQARQRLSPIGLNTVTVPTGHYNPYTVLMSMTSNNLSELRTVFDSVSSVLTETKLATVNFSSVITQSTSKILIHGYSDFPLPTWNAHIFNDATTMPTLAPVTRQSPETYATTIRFLRNFDPATPLNTWTVRHNRVAAITMTLNAAAVTAINGAATSRISLFVRNGSDTLPRVPIPNADTHVSPPITNPQVTVSLPEPTNPVPTTPALVTEQNMELHSFNSFDPADATYPLVKYYDTIDFAPTTAHLSGLSGLIIYSEELCASTVPMLSSLSKCSDDNNQFLQSAIPYSVTHLAINFRSRNPVTSRAIARLASTAFTQVCLSMFRRANVIYDNRLTVDTFDTGLQHVNYGLTALDDQSIPQFNQTVIGHNVSTGIQRARNAPSRFPPPATPTGQLLLWSPYSYVDATLDLSASPSASDLLHRLQFITNFRTLFGTTGQVYEATSPLEAIPFP